MGIEKFYNLSNFQRNWYHSTNTTITKFRDGSIKVFRTFEPEFQFTQEGLDEFFPEGFKIEKSSEYKTQFEKRLIEDENKERSLRRTKKDLKNYILNNSDLGSALFVTITNGHQDIGVDVPDHEYSRYNLNENSIFEINLEFKKRLLKKLNNLRTRDKLEYEYILVPEFHESGMIHYHGIFWNYPPDRLIFSGKNSKGSNIFYLIDFLKLGFTTATKVRSKHRISSYVTKYVSKDLSMYKGWKRFYCSSGLEKPQVFHITTDDDFMQHMDWCKNVKHGQVGFKFVKS